MDGFQKRLKTSVQLRLSLMLAAAITVMALVAAAFAFVTAFHEARETQDDVLYQVAALVREQQLMLADMQSYRLEDSDHDSVVLVRPLVIMGTSVASQHAPEFPATLADGLHTLRLLGHTLRTLVRTAPNGERFVVAQTTATRDAHALGTALRSLLPFALLLPFLLLLIHRLVRTLFRPIAVVAAQVDARSDHDLKPITEEPLPLEVRPFVHAINGLLARVHESITAQQRFIADAAHELRTPLTALALQAERLAAADMSPAAHTRLIALCAGIERASGLINQLLALSRVQAQQHTQVTSSTAPLLRSVIRQTLEGLMPLAESRHIEVALSTPCNLHVRASVLDLSTLIKNLVDNAIRYTPPGGRVTLACAPAGARCTLTVCDSGPGIAPAARVRVFEPFYRPAGSDTVGSGLGLAIVRTIVERLGGAIALDWADAVSQTGLNVAVTLPVVPDHTSSA